MQGIDRGLLYAPQRTLLGQCVVIDQGILLLYFVNSCARHVSLFVCLALLFLIIIITSTLAMYSKQLVTVSFIDISLRDTDGHTVSTLLFILRFSVGHFKLYVLIDPE